MAFYTRLVSLCIFACTRIFGGMLSVMVGYM